MLTFGSLFSGFGLMDLGLERAGMECKWQVEIDDYATRVLKKHWPDTPKFGDIRAVRATDLIPVDLICGGFPCQDVSGAGKREGISGERSGLWSEYARLVRDLRPRYILVENVGALLNRGIERVLGDLAEVGYDCEWEIIPASAVGAPHVRERIWIVAYPECRASLERSELALQWRRAQATEQIGLGSGGEELPHAKCAGLEGAIWRGSQRTRDRLQLASQHSLGRNGQWKVEPGICRVVDGSANRVQRLRGLGNAVVPQVVEYIGRRIIEDASCQP